MKKGFALLETLVVMTMVTISLILLYNTIFGATIQNKRNIWYDDAHNIYKTFYLKEYLRNKGLKKLIDKSDIKEISCDSFGEGCKNLVQDLGVSKMYVVKYDLREYDKSKYSESFNKYISYLATKDDFDYRFIVEFERNGQNLYASLDFNGEEL